MNESMPPSKATAARDILVVDDTPANLRLLSGMLIEQGYKVRSAPNGKLALMGARAVPPDLILLDINMPDMNGYQVCEQLKADPRTAGIPIIFISALDQTEDKIKAFTLGGVDYITKPFQIEEVLARVETHLTLHTLQRQLEAANQALLETNQQLEAANQELSARNADLNAFAHTVAHDLKNPVSAIVGFSSLLETRGAQMDSASVKETLHRITQSGYKMSDIIDTLLLFASVRRANQAELHPLDMPVVVNEVLERFEPQIQTARAELTVPEEWPIALGQPGWIEEVWANYLSNALKYGGTPPRIELGATPHDGFVQFWVRDRGPGLGAAEQAQLFNTFTRLHPEQAEGHGLGLSIVQRIVEKLGGAVGVESSGIPGNGCCFWFTLPTAQAPA